MTYQKPELLQSGAAINAIQASLMKGVEAEDNINDPASMSPGPYSCDE